MLYLVIDFNKTTEIGVDDTPQLGRLTLYDVRFVALFVQAGREAHDYITLSLMLTKYV